MTVESNLSAQVDDKDRPLREDVRMLGSLLGSTIRHFDGEAVFDIVEHFRKLCKAIHSEQNSDKKSALKAELKQLVESLDVETSGKIIKAFLTYFDLINIAEQNHRVRRRTQREHEANDRPEPDSLKGIFQNKSDQILKIIPKLDIQVVFTAHPTEITRRTAYLNVEIILLYRAERKIR
jgi:phosphoenolpyruvate carboxylase